MPPKFVRSTDQSGASASEKKSLLDDGGSDDEDFFLRGPNAKTGRLLRDDKINRLQGQVDEVVDVMQDNIGRVLDRGDKLEDLQDKSDDLSSHSDMFRSRAKILKSRMWWKECKMRILVAAVITIILLIIFIPIIVKYRHK